MLKETPKILTDYIYMPIVSIKTSAQVFEAGTKFAEVEWTGSDQLKRYITKDGRELICCPYKMCWEDKPKSTLF